MSSRYNPANCIFNLKQFTALLISLISLTVSYPIMATTQEAALKQCFDHLEPFKSRYELSSGIISVNSIHQLERSGDHWEYRNEADGGILGNALELSRFQVSDDGDFQLMTYQSRRRVAFNKKDKQVTVDWDSRLAQGSSGKYSVDNLVLFDKASQQLAIQCLVSAGYDEFTLSIAGFGGSDAYRYQVEGKHQLSIEGLLIPTVKVRQVRNDKREVEFWLAPEMNHLPVRFVYSEGGDESLSAKLIEYKAK